MDSKKVCLLKVHCMNDVMLTLDGELGLLLQEPAEVTFASFEYQYSGIAAILGFSYWKIICYCHCFLTAVSKEKRAEDLSVSCDLTAGIPKILL